MTPSITSLLDGPCNKLVDQAIRQGRIPLAYTCSYTPVPLLSVGRLFPLRVSAPRISGTEIADIYLSSVTCSYTRSILELAMDDQFQFLGGWVLAATCNQAHRLYDNLVYLVRPGFIHILDVPHKSGDRALKWYVEELRLLKDKLEAHFQVDAGEAALSNAIDEYNALHVFLEKIDACRKQPNPPVTGTEFYQWMIASAVTPTDLFLPLLTEYALSLDQRRISQPHRARLMVAGGELDDPDYIRAIESTGALVVADMICTGSVSHSSRILRDQDPLTDIAAHFLKQVSCPRMMEDFKKRLALIVEKIKAYQVDGVVIQRIKFCDFWGMESGLLMSELRKLNIPVLRLEREYGLTGEGQLKTRVQAFLESLGK
ncbi:MAG: 2-hydroxyacyl-CoA dehydratase family protein [Thermodesulfobacteriota bacterium]